MASRRSAGRSEPKSMRVVFEDLVLSGEALDVRLLHRDVRRAQSISERLHQQAVGPEVLDRLAQAARMADGAEALALLRSQGVGIHGEGRRGFQLPLDAVEPGGDDAAQGQVGVAAGV